MAEEIRRADVVEWLAKIAFGRANDAVKLVFLGKEEALERIGRLDLSMLAEIKKGSGDAIEIKLQDRVKALDMLLKIIDAQERGERDPDPTGLLRALDAATVREERDMQR